MHKEEYQVTKKIELLDYLLNNIKNKSKNSIKMLLSNRYICVNDKIITKHNYILKENDIVTIQYGYIGDIAVIYEDNEFIVINKPANLLTIATDNEKVKNLYSLVSSYVKKTNKHNKVFILHRLDKDTSGVIVFSKNKKTRDLLQNNWDNLVKTRKYIGIVHGKLTGEKKLISYLKENQNYNVFSVSNKNGGKKAITKYKVIKNNANYSLLEIVIETGRKNQIRVQLSDIKHPILGDKKYGLKDSFKRLYLHASFISFINPINNKEMKFKASIPSEFDHLIK